MKASNPLILLEMWDYTGNLGLCMQALSECVKNKRVSCSSALNGSAETLQCPLCNTTCPFSLFLLPFHKKVIVHLNCVKMLIPKFYVFILVKCLLSSCSHRCKFITLKP